ncbi:MAG: carboxylating nicotinate-nucleotide diphosphorylase [Myxococcales bacterium]|nr:carboxylating nicotinate-nucleotide diphosphorylase [Myxococcales bacterium]
MDSIDKIVALALEEDIGSGDLTTALTIPPGAVGKAEIVAKEPLVIAGLEAAERVFQWLSEGVVFTSNYRDGDTLAPGDIAATITGPLAPILTGERAALNFLQHLSGVATVARAAARAVEGTRARVLDTRKTTPGMRVLEKAAVRAGGAHNHRVGLFDGILIKENHIAGAGGIAAAVAQSRDGAPHTIRIEVEVTNLREVDEALGAGADALLLDNMTLDQVREAVTKIDGRALVEVSGGVTLANLRAVAETGVDLISMGALTHSAPAKDLSLLVRSR